METLLIWFIASIISLVVWGSVILWGASATRELFVRKSRDPRSGFRTGLIVGILAIVIFQIGFLVWRTLLPTFQHITIGIAGGFLICLLAFLLLWLAIAPSRALGYALLVLLALVFLIPIYMVIVTALKDPAVINLSTAWELPSTPHWESFDEVREEFGPRIRNSLILVTVATSLSSVMGSLNGYVLSKWRVPGEKYLFPLMLFGMFIPYQAILIPLFSFMKTLNLGSGILDLIVIHVVYGLPITTLIFRNFYVDIPDEMLEAGAIDGANFFELYTRIVFPLSLPGFVVVIIWQFTQIWNEFLFAVTMTAGSLDEPITVGLSNLAGGEAVKWNLPMAGAIVAALPPLLVYIIAGRYFIRGLLAGSVKG